MMYDKERKELETRLAELNARETAELANLKEFNIDPDLAHLATVLHDTQCHQNHIDGCWWSYENSDNKGLPDWNRGQHARYLDRARTILRYTDIQTAFLLTYVINGLTPPEDAVPRKVFHEKVYPYAQPFLDTDVDTETIPWANLTQQPGPDPYPYG